MPRLLVLRYANRPLRSGRHITLGRLHFDYAGAEVGQHFGCECRRNSLPALDHRNAGERAAGSGIAALIHALHLLNAGGLEARATASV
jgi:hypothetical protein